MAAALSLTFGRGGALIGNLIFGFLIDLNCVIPIVLFSAMLFSKYEKYYNQQHCTFGCTRFVFVQEIVSFYLFRD